LSEPKNGDSKAAAGSGCIRILHVDDDAGFLDVSKEILMEMDSRFDIDHACCIDGAFQN
jgi:hypothetical protein